jgi:hypothetical protein
MSGLKVLLLCHRPGHGSNADTIVQHIGAFERFSRHDVFCLSFRGNLPSGIDLDRFDVVVIHHTIWILSEGHLSADATESIRKFAGLKVILRQDEYISVDAVTEAMRRLGIDVLYTCIPPDEIDKVYPASSLPGVRCITTLTGFVSDDMLRREVAPIRERALDVAYRGRRLPYSLGELGTEKWRIVPQFLAATRLEGLVTDLSCDDKDRLYGEAWVRLLTSSKCMLGVESGASVFDFTGRIAHDVERYLSERPAAEFEEVRDRIFAAEEGRIRVNQIPPRCFEAAALRTAMILFEGGYSGVMEPWRHYVPLRKDFSNIGEVVSAIRQPELLQALADRAYREIAMNPRYSYRQFIAGLDGAIEAEFRSRSKPAAARPYTRAEYRAGLWRSPGFAVRRFVQLALDRVISGTQLRHVLQRVWYSVPVRKRARMKALLRWFGKTDLYIPGSGKS